MTRNFEIPEFLIQQTQMVLYVTDGGLQTLGGYGFIREYPVERWLRNGRGFPTFDGLAIV